MKKIYDDVDSLIVDIKKDLNITLSEEVFETVRDIELAYIEKDVMDSYKPNRYIRRKKAGIDDPDNIIRTVNNSVLEVENITEFNKGYGTSNRGKGLATLIDEGDGANGFYYDYFGEHIRPRRFLQNTVDTIQYTNVTEEALEKGMKRKGYDIT